VTHYFVRGGALVNFVAVREAPTWTEESWTTLSSKEELLAAFPGWHPHVQMLFEHSTHYYKWGLFDREPLPHWGRGRITLLGDAAHPMLPFLGQGAATGMEDAFLLAKLISDSDDIPTVLAAYETERKPRTTRIQIESRTRGRSVQAHSGLARLARNIQYRINALLDPAAPANRADWIYRYDVTGQARNRV
jgi:salicylate hydroxylase